MNELLNETPEQAPEASRKLNIVVVGAGPGGYAAAFLAADFGMQVTLIDPELTVKLPAGVTAGTGMDALAHAVECFTMVYHQPFTDAVALLAMEYVARYLRVAFSQANNLEARYHMSAAAML